MNYELKVIHRGKRNNGREYKQHDVKGEKVIAVKKNENFEILFKNNTDKLVQVRISIDGLDILTGEKANINPYGKMFSVDAKSTMTLSAWPETYDGGARLVFTDKGNSVAEHVLKDVNSIGLIAAAVFIEEPKPNYITWTNPYFYNDWWNKQLKLLETKPNPYKYSDYTITWGSGSIITNPTKIYTTCLASNSSEVSCNSSEVSCKTPAVGAGEYTSQSLKLQDGFYTAKLDETIVIRYEWFKKDRKVSSRATKTSAFPGSKLLDLKKTPRIESIQGEYGAQRFV